MRRLVVPVLCTVTIAAPIPVALGQAGPDITGEAAAELATPPFEKAELLQEARTAKRAARRRAAKKRARSAPAVAIPPQLAAIAQCESGGDPRAIGGGGAYRGLFQFDYGTWASVGGTGDPAAAPAAEQIRRAAILYERAGSSPWPVCG